MCVAAIAACGRSHQEPGASAKSAGGSSAVTPKPTIKEEMVAIAGGPFRGRTANCASDSLTPSTPRAETEDGHGTTVDLNVSAFEIDVSVVACADIEACRRAGVCTSSGALQAICKYGTAIVSLADASSYCAWRDAHLPTLYEWERAVRGHNGNIFPWGMDARTVTCTGSDSDKNACTFSSPDGVTVNAGPHSFGEWTSDTDCGRDVHDKTSRLPLVVDYRSFRLDEVRAMDPVASLAAFRCTRPTLSR
jgi:hypothetical protein